MTAPNSDMIEFRILKSDAARVARFMKTYDDGRSGWVKGAVESRRTFLETKETVMEIIRLIAEEAGKLGL